MSRNSGAQPLDLPSPMMLKTMLPLCCILMSAMNAGSLGRKAERRLTLEEMMTEHDEHGSTSLTVFLFSSVLVIRPFSGVNPPQEALLEGNSYVFLPRDSAGKQRALKRACLIHSSTIVSFYSQMLVDGRKTCCMMVFASLVKNSTIYISRSRFNIGLVRRSSTSKVCRAAFRSLASHPLPQPSQTA